MWSYQGVPKYQLLNTSTNARPVKEAFIVKLQKYWQKLSELGGSNRKMKIKKRVKILCATKPSKNTAYTVLTILWFLIILSNSSLIFLYFSSVWGVRTYEASGSGLSQPLCSFLFSACSEHQHKDKKSTQNSRGQRKYLHRSAWTLNHCLRLVSQNGRPWGGCARNSHRDLD